MVYNAAVACAAQLVVSRKFGVVQTVTTELSSLVSTTKAARLPVECVENIKITMIRDTKFLSLLTAIYTK